MPQKSGMFDTTIDDPREYPAREFAEYFARFVTNGVFNGGSNLQATASGADSNVKVAIGAAWIKGYAYSVYDSPLTLAIAPATTLDRIDRIVLRLDTSTPVRSIKAIVVQGTPSASPTAPVLVRSGDNFDLSLAQVRVVANSSIVAQANITDERLNESVCGLVNSLIRVDTATFQQQWDAFILSIQNNGFATTQYVDTKALTPGYGVATGTANAYAVTISPSPTALTDGLTYRVKINVASTGASTINTNGLGARSVKKNGGGNPNFKAGGIYTVAYDATTTSFILQGEGGEYGTAGAGQTLAGYNAGTESGLVEGAIFNNGAGGVVTPTASAQTKPPGYYSSPITIAGVTNLTAPNIRFGAEVGGVTGTSVELKQLSGSGSISKPGNEVRVVTVSGLTFLPRIIVFGSLNSTGTNASTGARMFINGVLQPYWASYGGGHGSQIATAYQGGFTVNIMPPGADSSTVNVQYYWWACE